MNRYYCILLLWPLTGAVASATISTGDKTILPDNISGRQGFSESSRQKIQHLRLMKQLQPRAPDFSDDGEKKPEGKDFRPAIKSR